MLSAKAMNSPLKWDVFVSSQILAVTSDLPPGTDIVNTLNSEGALKNSSNRICGSPLLS